MLAGSSFERFMIYPNESIDKLTVNRAFERLYDEIDSKDMSEFPITVSKATDSVYGTVKYSSSNKYYKLAPEPTESQREYDDYFNAPMNLDALTDYASKMSTKSDIMSMYTSGAAPLTGHSGWLKIDIGSFSTMDMPNGNKMVVGNFDISLSNLQIMFGTPSVTSEANVNTTELTGFGTVINMSDDDIIAINDFVLDTETHDAQTRTDVNNLKNLDGKEMESPYFGNVKATMRHNSCNWTKYSSYKQSYIEVVFSMSLDLGTLYNKYNGYRKYTMFDGASSTEVEYTSSLDAPLDYVFTAEPIVMPQLSFYNNETRPLPTFGYSKAVENVQENEFISTNTISDKELSTEEKEGYEVSVVNGNVIMKKFENVYRTNGDVMNNKMYFDVSMKFMVGGAYDPFMIDGIRNINSKAKLQFMMIGV